MAADNVIRDRERQRSYKAASLYNANAVYRYGTPGLTPVLNQKRHRVVETINEILNYNRQTFMDSRYEGNG